jgi:UDP-glucose 6-dehydrogenase
MSFKQYYIFGLGYVGCVTAACLADDVIVSLADINPHKVDLINSGSRLDRTGLK